ncbi:ChuX/HutX family heme-like substrate-binding protein [Chitinivorax sp. B]|uniref:hemin-degrading factor n=1 Tax=Chitinivorax sp. B TaxID=2502235 RepID=UPI0010F79703|nr:ChuX/HutX family heme-like substrate-binding protein [Chitinivorax sp. B]
MTSQDNPLYAAWQALCEQEPKLRIREAASRLGVNEAALVDAQCGVQATRLVGDLRALFKQLGSLGDVMALTRNDFCVHERHGTYLNIQAEGMIGLTLGDDIDLRVFFSQWRHAFAVEEPGQSGPRRSLQFFDARGMALHKVYLTEHSDVSAYQEIRQQYAVTASDRIELDTTPVIAERLDVEVDVATLRNKWLALKDTHDFFSMLKSLALPRLTALRHAGGDLACEVSYDAVERVLHWAAETATDIMVFVGNPGMVQIHTGKVQRLLRTGPWFNVLDERFSMHLNTTAIASSWVVSKPTVDGWVTSLELYDVQGGLIVQLFGKRKPGLPELPDWRAMLLDLIPAEETA